MPDKKVQCVRVVIRCRPMSDKEMSAGKKVVVKVDQKRGEVTVVNIIDNTPRTFTFDQTYNFDSRQQTIFNETAWPIIENVLEGYNGTIFAYGQTGTGKTHTMEGDVKSKTHCGIMPRAFKSIFQDIQTGEDKQFLVRCSYLELYNEEVRDLLGKNPERKLELHEHPDTGVYVKDISMPVIKTPQDLLQLHFQGAGHRAQASTDMNQRSSRSHSLFQITIETSQQDEDGVAHIRVGKLNMVDLAGSERQKKTNATGDRQKQAISINQSLTTLGHVIYALVDKKHTHVPYRDSKLTRLLQDSLGGNTKTVMIANIGPADYNYDETINTLRYASNAKMIKNKPKINEDPKDALLREYQEQIARLRAQLGDNFDPNTLHSLSENLQSQGVMGGVKVIEVKKVKQVEDQEKTREVAQKLEKELEQIHKQATNEIQSIKKQKQLKQEEKEKLINDIKEKQEKQLESKQKKKELVRKLKDMEDVINIGHSAKEKSQKQEIMLRKKEKQLREQKRHEQEIQRELAEKQKKALRVEKKFNSQKEELEDKNETLQMTWNMYQEKKLQINDLSDEFQRQREEMMETIHELMRQIKMKQMIIKHFIPPEQTKKIERRKIWSEDLNDFVLKPRNFTGGPQGVKVARPNSAVGLKRPTSEYTRINKGMGEANPRYKAQNILQLDLDYAQRTTEDYIHGQDSERVQNAISSVLQEHDDNTDVPPYLPFEEADAIEQMMQQKKQRVKSAKRPGTAKRKKQPAGEGHQMMKAAQSQAQFKDTGAGGVQKVVYPKSKGLLK